MTRLQPSHPRCYGRDLVSGRVLLNGVGSHAHDRDIPRHIPEVWPDPIDGGIEPVSATAVRSKLEFDPQHGAPTVCGKGRKQVRLRERKRHARSFRTAFQRPGHIKTPALFGASSALMRSHDALSFALSSFRISGPDLDSCGIDALLALMGVARVPALPMPARVLRQRLVFPAGAARSHGREFMRGPRRSTALSLFSAHTPQFISQGDTR